MSMFFTLVGDGWLNKKNLMPDGMNNFNEPRVITRAEILEEYGENPEINLDKSTCKQVQVLDSWKGNGYYYEELLVKAMGYQQATELAEQYGRTKAPGYLEHQQAVAEYKEQVRKTKEAAKKVAGWRYYGI